MKIIVGLGNPGKKYENTRHNAGFMFVDKMRDFLGWDNFYDVSDWKSDRSFESEICEARGGVEKKILLVRPLTFMNESGRAVQKLVAMYHIDITKDLVLVHDDLDIELGNIKIQSGVSPKKHNGVLSVESLLGNRDFLRVRLGVDSRMGNRIIPGEDYVLLKMNDEELQKLQEEIDDGIKLLRTTIDV